MVKDYDTLTFRDLNIKYEGWRDMENAHRFDSWDQARILAYYIVSASPQLKTPHNLDRLFRNPYDTQEPQKVVIPSRAELMAKSKKRKGLEYTKMKPGDFRRAKKQLNK